MANSLEIGKWDCAATYPYSGRRSTGMIAEERLRGRDFVNREFQHGAAVAADESGGRAGGDERQLKAVARGTASGWIAGRGLHGRDFRVPIEAPGFLGDDLE